MCFWRGASVFFGILLVMACSHPLEIKGEGDILSASGTRNCYLENFQAGAESCSKNLVVGEYRETYYAVPRDGWEFISWENCFDDGSVADQCRFDFDQSVVRQFWGETAAPLVAVFQQSAPPPKPIAMYSYGVDEDGLLLDPLPLEGARLERKAVYFTFTGNYELVKFWCCKVPDGQEAHNEPVEDRVPPFVFRVDLGALPDDAGLPRELYADLFTSATDYSGHAANWTLEGLSSSPTIFNDGGTHTVDYTIPGQVEIGNSTTVNLVDGAVLKAGVVKNGGSLQIFGGEVYGGIYNWFGDLSIYGGDVPGSIINGDASLSIYGGSVGWIEAWTTPPSAQTSIHGGTVGGILGTGQNIRITGGTVGTIFAEGERTLVRLEISGGKLIGDIWIANIVSEITGGEFLASIRTKQQGLYEVKGGTFSEPFVYYDEPAPLPFFIFYGDLQLTDPVRLDSEYEYQSEITGTLSDGSHLSQKVTCVPWSGTDDPFCQGVEIVSN